MILFARGIGAARSGDPAAGGALVPRLRWAPLIPKQAFEARRRQLGITHRMLDRFVPEVGLDRTGIDALVRQLEPTGMPQHVRVDFHIEASGRFAIGSLKSTKTS